MAPATSAGATRAARVGRPARWTRTDIIEAITEWAALYGEPPRAADWNPSAARWSAATWRIARYRKGRPDGTPWPSLNSAKALFGGSLNAALEAAGFEPNKPGPKRRSEVTTELLERSEMAPVVRVALEAARADARAERARREAADRARAKAEARLERVRAQLRTARARRRPVLTKPKTKLVRERVVDDAGLERTRAKAGKALATAKDHLAKARADAAEARRSATRAAAKLERAEATISTLRAERRDVRAERDDAVLERNRAEDRLAAVEAQLAGALERVSDLRGRETVVRLPTPEATAVEVAREEAEAAGRRAGDAEERAARAERRYAELAHAVTGEHRRLTPTEIEELRSEGPAGPKLLAEALGRLARARKDNDRHGLRKTLAEVASAAISWRERL